MSTQQENGKKGENAVALVLLRCGFAVKQMEYDCPYDLLVDNRLRVEVKVSKMRPEREIPTWTFNIHRHGRVVENEVDIYILRLEGVPYMKYAAVHMLIYAPIGTPVVTVSFRSLLQRYAIHIHAFNEFCVARGSNVKRIKNADRSIRSRTEEAALYASNSVKKAAVEWEVSVKRVYQLIDAGIAKAKKQALSGRLYFTDAEIERVKGRHRPKGRPRKAGTKSRRPSRQS